MFDPNHWQRFCCEFQLNIGLFFDPCRGLAALVVEVCVLDRGCKPRLSGEGDANDFGSFFLAGGGFGVDFMFCFFLG